MADRVQFRRDTAVNWYAYNPILLEGEVAYDLDGDQYKLGDGEHAWRDLPYRGLPCVQQTGDSTTTPMSQKAVTDALKLKIDKENIAQELQDNDVDNVPSSEAVLKFFGKYVESNRFVRAYLDDNDKILWGIQRDGNIWFGAGVPNQIKDFILSKVSEILIELDELKQILDDNVLAIEFEPNGDIAAYYDAEGNIHDVYIEPNGDIIVEQNIN